MVRPAVVAVVALVMLAGCIPTPSQPTPMETIDYSGPPLWDESEDVGETRVSFARGVELVPGSRVHFGSRLGGIYDWEPVGPSSAELTELVNVNAGCRVRDETSAYTGAADDETASRDLVLGLLADDEIIGGPQATVGGIGEGLGEGAPMYDVMHALASDPSGGYVYVAGRVFAALGVQHAITVRCELGGYLDRTRSQIATTTWVELDLPEPPHVPAGTSPPCTSDDLVMTYSPLLEDALSLTGVLEFRNDSRATCSVAGYPVLYFSDPGPGSVLGPRAEYDTRKPPVPADLSPGLTATAIVTIQRAEATCAETAPTDGFIGGAPSEAFDPENDGRFIPVTGLEACTDYSVALLAVEGLWS